MTDSDSVIVKPPVPEPVQDDPFVDSTQLPGLEVFGRAIVDGNGAPSGSFANYENLRGLLDITERVPTADVIAAQEQEIANALADVIQFLK